MAEQKNKQGVINRDANAAQRATLAVRLRASKMTFQAIAHQCGYGSPGAARNAVQRELQRVVVEDVSELRREECYTLDLLQVECMKLVLDKDNKARLFAVDRMLAIMERRARLMGLDQSADSALVANQIVIREVPIGYMGVTEVKS